MAKKTLALIRSLRPEQWLKNGFVLAPIVFSGLIHDPEAWLRSLMAAAAFCAASSAVYLVNDVLDREADRVHPIKQNRPIAAFLKDELLQTVGHCLWTFTIPKMLRPYFMHRRELLGDLARLAYETIKELMIEAVADDKARPGVVAVPQSFGSVLNAHPHTHCLASRGVWDAQGQWLPVPYIDLIAAERLFRHKIMHLLNNKGLLSDERI